VWTRAINLSSELFRYVHLLWCITNGMLKLEYYMIAIELSRVIKLLPKLQLSIKIAKWTLFYNLWKKDCRIIKHVHVLVHVAIHYIIIKYTNIFFKYFIYIYLQFWLLVLGWSVIRHQ
jgi:hypothetical protein